jgi:hypothetical protein
MLLYGGADMNIKDFKVGDTVYIIDANYRTLIKSVTAMKKCTLIETTVTNVGRKLVTVDWHDAKFGNKEYGGDGHPMYLVSNFTNSDDMLFRSREDFNRYIEVLEMSDAIREFCGYNLDVKLSADKIKSIYDIIRGGEDD